MTYYHVTPTLTGAFPMSNFQFDNQNRIYYQGSSYGSSYENGLHRLDLSNADGLIRDELLIGTKPIDVDHNFVVDGIGNIFFGANKVRRPNGSVAVLTGLAGVHVAWQSPQLEMFVYFPSLTLDGQTTSAVVKIEPIGSEFTYSIQWTGTGPSINCGGNRVTSDQNWAYVAGNCSWRYNYATKNLESFELPVYGSLAGAAGEYLYYVDGTRIDRVNISDFSFSSTTIPSGLVDELYHVDVNTNTEDILFGGFRYSDGKIVEYSMTFQGVVTFLGTSETTYRITKIVPVG